MYFGLLFVKLKLGVAESEKTGRHHISTSGLASGAHGMLLFALFWPVLSRYRILMARNAFYKKTGSIKSKSVAREYNSETGNTFKSARNGPAKLTVIRKKRHGQTGSGFAKPEVVVYFGLLLDKLKVGVAAVSYTHLTLPTTPYV